MIEMRKRKRSETASFFLAKMFYFLLFVSRILYLNLYASRVSLYQHMPWWSSWCFLSHLPSHARYQLCSTGYVVHAWFISNTHGSNHFVIRIFGRRRALFTTPLIQHWYCGPISDSVFGEPNTPQQKRQRYGLSNGSVYEATEPAVKASEAAHEATELVAKASEAAHAQHKDHVFIIFLGSRISRWLLKRSAVLILVADRWIDSRVLR